MGTAQRNSVLIRVNKILKEHGSQDDRMPSPFPYERRKGEADSVDIFADYKSHRGPPDRDAIVTIQGEKEVPRRRISPVGTLGVMAIVVVLAFVAMGGAWYG